MDTDLVVRAQRGDKGAYALVATEVADRFLAAAAAHRGRRRFRMFGAYLRMTMEPPLMTCGLAESMSAEPPILLS